MRAVRVHELMGPRELRVEELPAPVPGEGEVLISVRAAGVNFPEVLLSYGKYQFKPSPPFTLGGEGAGVISALGSGVSRFEVGDRVVFTMINGAWAEQVVVSTSVVTRLPDAVSFETGAVTLVTYATSWHALVDRASLKPGETLLVLGAAGGVGAAAVQLGKLLGARVIAAASSAEKLAFCKAMGADEVIDYSKEDLKERVKALTNGDGAEVIYDAVGGANAEAALRAIAWEGRYLVVGFASGEIPKIPLNLVLLKGCQIVGVFWGSFVAREPERNQVNCERIFEEIAKGRLKPHVHGVFPFERAGEALELLEKRAVHGKLALVPR
jgi:NADPH2:quinone reductase